MVSKFIVEFDRIDWKELSTQKEQLFLHGGEDWAEGLINLIDYIQDAAEEQGQPVVWLDEGDKDVYD
jgi:hypothetical protein